MKLIDIVKLEYLAKFTHAIAGVLYYQIDTPDVLIVFSVDMNDKDDVGTATFLASYKPVTMMRYIRKAMESDSLIIIQHESNK